MKKIFAFAIAALLTTTILSCSSNWTMQGGNSQRTFSNDTSLGANLSVKWDYGFKSLALSNLADDNKYLYCVITDSDLNGLVTLDKQNGNVYGKPIILPQSYTYTIALDDANIYVATGETISVYEKNSRLLLWDKTFEDEDVFSIIPDKKLLYGISSQGSVFAIHIDTGEYKWKWQINPNYIYRWILKNQNMLMVAGNKKGTQEQAYVMLDSSYGNYLWTKYKFGPPESIPQTVGNKLIISTNTAIECCDIATGAVIWQWKYPKNEDTNVLLTLETTPSIIEDDMFCCLDGKIIQLSLRDGKVTDETFVPTKTKTKLLCASNDALYLALEGDPFFYTYNRIEKRFIKKMSGHRIVLGCSISDALYMQSQESIACYK